MGKKSILSMCWIICSLLLVACVDKQMTQPTISATCDEVSQLIQTPSHISYSVSNSNKKLMLDADVVLPETVPSSEIILHPDLESTANLASDFGLTQGLTDDGYESCYVVKDKAGNRMRTLTSNKYGAIRYLDIANNSNASMSKDLLHQLDPYYVTEYIPVNMNLTGTEVAADLAKQFEEYSCFTFIPWNVCAYEASEGQPDRGYYSVKLMPVYDGIPVSIHSTVQELRLWVNAKVSNNGVFAFQGTFSFIYENSSEKSQLVSVDSVIQNLSNNFDVLISGEELSIERISLQYYAQQDKNGVLVLHPVWVFEGIEYMSKEATGYESIENQFTVIYWADTGALIDIFNGENNTSTVS